MISAEGIQTMGLLMSLVIGALSGWIAGQLMKGKGFGVLGNLVVGILGSVIGGWLFSQLGASAGGGILGSIITSVVGAVVLLFLAGKLKG